MKKTTSFLFITRQFCSSSSPRIVQSSLTVVPVDTSSNDDVSAGASSANNRVSLPTVVLPRSLKESLFKVLSNYPPKSLINDGEAMVHYLTSRGPSSPLRYNRRETIGFAAGRTEAVYGATYRVLNELSKIDGTFAPQTMLDFGSGLGTAIWAAHSLWGSSLYEYQTIDTSPDMGELARVLRTGGDEWASICDNSLTLPTSIGQEAIPGVYFRQFLPVSNKRSYDLVISAYSLSEIPTASLWKQTLFSLWRKTDQYLVLIEVANPSGFSIISKARELLLMSRSYDSEGTVRDREGHVVAPCPHDGQCPLLREGEVCRFGQRVAVPFSQYKRHRAAGFFIEHFSYLVLKKGPRPSQSKPHPSRILVPTKKRSRHTIARLCCPNGEAKTLVFTKGKHKELQREARRKQWGDTIQVPTELYEQKEEENRREEENGREGDL